MSLNHLIDRNVCSRVVKTQRTAGYHIKTFWSLMLNVTTRYEVRTDIRSTQ